MDFLRRIYYFTIHAPLYRWTHRIIGSALRRSFAAEYVYGKRNSDIRKINAATLKFRYEWVEKSFINTYPMTRWKNASQGPEQKRRPLWTRLIVPHSYRTRQLPETQWERRMDLACVYFFHMYFTNVRVWESIRDRVPYRRENFASPKIGKIKISYG